MSKKENFSVGPWHFHKQTLCYDGVIQVADLPTNAELKCFLRQKQLELFLWQMQSWNILISSARNQLTPSRKPNQEPCILRRNWLQRICFCSKLKKLPITGLPDHWLVVQSLSKWSSYMLPLEAFQSLKKFICFSSN